jgi:Fe2+ transport system protein FeoA
MNLENERMIILSQMEIGQKGKILEIKGEKGVISRLSALGIRVGEEIKKISQQAMKGPVVVKVGKSQVAVGFKMANGILVEIYKEG